MHSQGLESGYDGAIVARAPYAEFRFLFLYLFQLNRFYTVSFVCGVSKPHLISHDKQAQNPTSSSGYLVASLLTRNHVRGRQPVTPYHQGLGALFWIGRLIVL